MWFVFQIVTSANFLLSDLYSPDDIHTLPALITGQPDTSKEFSFEDVETLRREDSGVTSVVHVCLLWRIYCCNIVENQTPEWFNLVAYGRFQYWTCIVILYTVPECSRDCFLFIAWSYFMVYFDLTIFCFHFVYVLSIYFFNQENRCITMFKL